MQWPQVKAEAFVEAWHIFFIFMGPYIEYKSNLFHVSYSLKPSEVKWSGGGIV